MGASLIDDMLDEHATLNEDLDAKQRTEMHDLAEHHDSNNDNCHNKGNFGWSGSSSSATAISVPQTRSASAAKLAILRGAAEIRIAAEHAGASSSTGSTAASSNFDFWHNNEVVVCSTLSSA